MKNSSDDLAVVNIALVTYKLFAGGDPRRIGAQIDDGDDALVFRVNACDQSFAGARDPEASSVKYDYRP